MPARVAGRDRGNKERAGVRTGRPGQASQRAQTVLTTGERAESGEMQTDNQELEVAVIPHNSFYKGSLGGSDSGQTNANIGILSLSHDMRDVIFLRKLLSAKVVVRKAKFVHNSRLMVRTIFRKKLLVEIKRISVQPGKAARSNASEDNSRSCETISHPVPVINVTFINDEDIVKISDQQVPVPTAVYPHRMSPLSYLKPSQSEDNYGLGGFLEMMRDDADQPRKVIPGWAKENRVKVQMMKQIKADADKIFAPRVLNVADLCSMFPNKSLDLWNKPWCDSPSPKKTARGKENERSGTKKLRF